MRKIFILLLMSGFVLSSQAQLLSDNNSTNRECSDIDNSEECYDIGCEWNDNWGCYNLNDNWDDWESQCSGLPQDECIGNEYCDWSIITTPNGVFEICIEVDDGGWNNQCSDLGYEDCEAVDYCEWISDNNNPNNSGYCVDFSDNDDCDPNLLCGEALTCCDGLLYPTTCCSENCDEPIGECDDYYEGCQSDNGDWYDIGHEMFINDCEYYECTESGWEGPFELDNDGCSDGNDWECSDLGYEDCQAVDYCEWISDSDNPNSWGTCVEIGGNDDGPPECLMDCEGIEDINPNDDPYGACDWIISAFGFDPGFASCTGDCDDDTMMEINEIVEACYECLEMDNVDCADVFDDEDECGGAGLNEDGCCDFQSMIECVDELGNQFECGDDWMDCPEPGVPGGSVTLQFSLEVSGTISLALTSECGDVTILIDNEYYSAGMYSYVLSVSELGLFTGAYQIQLESNENIETAYFWVCGFLETECSELNYPDCIENEECEWMITTEWGGYSCVEIEICEDLDYEQCIGSQGCQPNYNAAGEFEGCEDVNNQFEFGSLYGTVSYIYGDVVNFVPYAQIHIESLPSNADMFYFETTTNGDGYYAIELPPGAYIVTAYANEESLMHDVQIAPNSQNELNFLLGDWGGPWDPYASLNLGSTQAVPGSDVIVPLYLSSNESVGGVQFTIGTNMPGILNPAGIESWDPCFSADYNVIDEGLIGIIFSFEGCTYPPEEMLQIADLVFNVSDDVSFGNEVELFFNNTIVSDAVGNEIPSYGNGGVVLIGAQGDINADGEFNVLDVVMMVNFALSTEEPSDSQFWASDLNNDGAINVLDVVQLVNLILGN